MIKMKCRWQFSISNFIKIIEQTAMFIAYSSFNISKFKTFWRKKKSYDAILSFKFNYSECNILYIKRKIFLFYFELCDLESFCFFSPLPIRFSWIYNFLAFVFIDPNKWDIFWKQSNFYQYVHSIFSFAVMQCLIRFFQADEQ